MGSAMMTKHVNVFVPNELLDRITLFLAGVGRGEPVDRDEASELWTLIAELRQGVDPQNN